MAANVAASLITKNCIRCFSLKSTLAQRAGNAAGDSGWKWEKGGIGMGGKDHGPGTEAKKDVGKDKTYKAPEFFKYNKYSFFDVEGEMTKSRCPQPKSGLTEFW